jgi:signal transduction histidine kinase
MREMSKLYTYVNELHEPPHEVLLVPFEHNGAAVGTVWIVRHDDSVGFDSEDLRVVGKLTRFASAAVESAARVRTLTAANEAMREIGTRRDRFMAILAHELRSPLGAISLGMQIIKRAGDDPERRASILGVVERQVGQLTSLMKDMTDVAAICCGKLALNRTLVSVQELVADALETCGERLLTKQQRLDVQLPEQVLLLDGDAGRLKQVLVNLINNAAKYTPEGGDIAVRSTRCGGCVEISITDSGVGLEASDLPHVFDMYMQVHMDDRPVDSGLGIGLALVKQLVELHQGQVSVASDGPGKGSTFKVVLPLHGPRLPEIDR